MKDKLLSVLLVFILVITMIPDIAFAAEDELQMGNANSYEVSTGEELKNALIQIAAGEAAEATIVLKADIQAPTENYVATFGVAGKNITVQSPQGEMHTLSFSNRGMLNGSCIFDNVNVTGYKLYCNGYRTIFTENGQIHLTGTLYGGGYKTTVDSTYVVVAASGSINPSATNGLHSVIGGSYQGAVEGDTYLEITGSLIMQGGNWITPGCVKGDGTSGDASNSPNVYVGGNATLIYDNPNSNTSPAITGTYGCEMKGNVLLDIRSGRANGICGTYYEPETSVIRGNLHIIAGAEKYENADRTLRLSGNWPIVGAGHSFAREPSAVGNYEVDGDITIDTYENVWGWEKGTNPGYDIPEIYGAIRGNVGGSITINAHGSHMENITGASDASKVDGDVTINAANVELKNCYYEDPDYDEGDILANYISTVDGKCLVYVDGGDVNIVRLTRGKTVSENSEITITGRPKIRTGVISTRNFSSSPEDTPIVNLTACTATIPFIQSAAKVHVMNHSDATVNGLWLVRDLTVEEESILKTDDLDLAVLDGNAVVNGIWEQLYDEAGDSDYDISIAGTMTVGSNGEYISHGSTCVEGDVNSSGRMALMKPSLFQGTYTGTDAELRLPVVQTGKNYNAGKIPLQISGLASGITTVNTVKENDWNSLQTPVLGDNYILTKKNGDNPVQNTFTLGNEDALRNGLFLKRKNDAAGTSDRYMWQVAAGITVTFDKNHGDTEATPRIVSQEKNASGVNHFDLPTTNPTRSGYSFMGWNTEDDGTGDEFTATYDVTQSMTVYAQWKPEESNAIEISPMDITVYIGGEGYYGVIGEDGTFSENDFPEIGFYLTLPDDVNSLLGSSADNPVDLSGKLELTYDDDNGTTRSWSLKLYGDESQSHVMMDGRHVYIYKLLPSQIDGTMETIPIRMQYTSTDGSVMVNTKFPVSEIDQYRDYKISFYPGQLDEQIYQATFTTTDGRTIKRPIKLGTGTLKVRGNTDQTYREISTIEPTVDQQEQGIFLVDEAQTDTRYYLNNNGISVDPAGVKLLVDHSLSDTELSDYLNQNHNEEGKYSYIFRYLDLVDTNNGNAYVSMGAGQKMNIYWPVPNDAQEDSEFHIVHFKDMDRETNTCLKDMLQTNIPEELTCETVTVDGQKFIKFSTGSFSPFALLYEKKSNTNLIADEPNGSENISPVIYGVATTGEKKQTIEEEEKNKQNVTDEKIVDKSPQTGDSLWIIWVFLAAGGALIVIGSRQKYQHDKEKADL